MASLQKYQAVFRCRYCLRGRANPCPRRIAGKKNGYPQMDVNFLDRESRSWNGQSAQQTQGASAIRNPLTRNRGRTFGLLEGGVPIASAISDISFGQPFGPTWLFSFFGNHTVNLYIEGVGGDNVGVIIDNVQLEGPDQNGSVPEPATLALLGLGLAGLATFRRRKQA
jgi:hypothetical protein